MCVYGLRMVAGAGVRVLQIFSSNILGMIVGADTIVITLLNDDSDRCH